MDHTAAVYLIDGKGIFAGSISPGAVSRPLRIMLTIQSKARCSSHLG